MLSRLRTYLRALRHYPFAALSALQHYFRRPGKDFTRTRILHLDRLAWLNITLLKCTLCVKPDQFFSWLNSEECSPTKSTLVQARQKLLPPFFGISFKSLWLPIAQWQRLHNYKPNRNVSVSLLKRFLVKFTLCPVSQFKEHIQDYHRQILQTMGPIRPGKNKERRPKLMRGTERHVHEKNYRLAM